ncbi:MAG: hypothetical protein ACR2NU_14160, partial [Aeoliella sp.]
MRSYWRSGSANRASQERFDRLWREASGAHLARLKWIAAKLIPRMALSCLATPPVNVLVLLIKA